MTERFDIEIDGQRCAAQQGETVLQVAARSGIEIPTLCDDARLDPVGACRVCLVEVEGQQRLQPGCAWRVEPEMKVVTASERIERHRRVLRGLGRPQRDVSAVGRLRRRRTASRRKARDEQGNQKRSICHPHRAIP